MHLDFAGGNQTLRPFQLFHRFVDAYQLFRRNKTFADSRWSDPEGAVLHFDGYIAVVGGYPAQLPHLVAYIANEFFDFLFLHRCHLV